MSPNGLTKFRLKNASHILVEISSGDFMDDPLIGVTLCNLRSPGREILHDLNKCCFSVSDVVETITSAEKEFE